MANKVTYIYWTKKAALSPDKERRIRDRFRLGSYKSVNGETPAEHLSPDDMQLLREVEKQGYIQIRLKEE